MGMPIDEAILAGTTEHQFPTEAAKLRNRLDAIEAAFEDRFKSMKLEIEAANRGRLNSMKVEIEAAFGDTRLKSTKLMIEAANRDTLKSMSLDFHNRLKAIEEVTAEHTWALAKIQMRGLLERFEAMALWRLEIPGAEQNYSESAASRAWRLWVGSLPKGSAREELIKTIEARIGAADGEITDLEILLKEEAALDVLLNGSRSEICIDRNSSTHGDALSYEDYNRIVQVYYGLKRARGAGDSGQRW
ncbi:hypothetical protein BD779DRAFT_1678929 [Infundibulicybe gibba]|nr:hypothetical protein BD779DRAFT_1678929 [Infundibulicybe gibba]